MQNRHLFIILALAMLTLYSCNSRKVYSQYEHVEASGWEKADTIWYVVPPVSKSGTYREELGLRSNGHFPYQELTIEIRQIIWPKGEQQFYRINCPLFENNGKAKGSGISLYQNEFLISDIQLNKGDSLRIAVIHQMRRNQIPGITDVGISLSQQHP